MKNKNGRRWLFGLLCMCSLFFIYVQYTNRNTIDMTGRQKILKSIYPVLMGASKLLGKKSRTINNTLRIKPETSFYTLTDTLNNGETFSFETLRGKKVLLVNTASDCGYTNQYEELQKLYEQYKNKLVVIGFPSNDFKEQEKGTDEEIEQFCKKNYGIGFPLMKKSSVISSQHKNNIYRWLSDSGKNGWNNQQPTWNFSKYLVDENGTLINYFDPSISPLSSEVRKAIEQTSVR